MYVGPETNEVIRSLTMLAFAAFPVLVRREMFKRDKGVCKACGVSHKDGWMLEASHINHDAPFPWKNSIDNGQMECRRCHLFYSHYALYRANPSRRNENMLVAITTRVFAFGYKSRKHLDGLVDPDRSLALSRNDMANTFEQYNDDMWNYIDVDELYENYGIDLNDDYTLSYSNLRKHM